MSEQTPSPCKKQLIAKRLLLVAVLLGLAVVLAIALDTRMIVQYYEMDAPELFAHYASRGFDLVLCGHAHGGQWRIPGVLNGLYAPNQGLFPPHAGGKYEKDGTTMIVSRGLARESTFAPRIFNPPELVVITIN